VLKADITLQNVKDVQILFCSFFDNYISVCQLQQLEWFFPQ